MFDYVSDIIRFSEHGLFLPKVYAWYFVIWQFCFQKKFYAIQKKDSNGWGDYRVNLRCKLTGIFFIGEFRKALDRVGKNNSKTMAISIRERQLITQFIANTQNLNIPLHTNGGGCADLVRGIIEQATGKRISVNPFVNSLESMIRKIDTYADLTLCNNGDILYFVHLPNAANVRQTIHYAIFCNVNTNIGQYNVIGINGLTDLSFNPTPYHNVVASVISQANFNAAGQVLYDPAGGILSELYVIDYDLI